MAVNVAYYSQLVEAIKLALGLFESIKPLVLQLAQLVEAEMPQGRGSDKLKVVMDGVKAMLAKSVDLPEQLDVFWTGLQGVISVFVSIQKIMGNVKAGTPPA